MLKVTKQTALLEQASHHAVSLYDRPLQQSKITIEVHSLVSPSNWTGHIFVHFDISLVWTDSQLCKRIVQMNDI